MVLKRFEKNTDKRFAKFGSQISDLAVVEFIFFKWFGKKI